MLHIDKTYPNKDTISKHAYPTRAREVAELEKVSPMPLIIPLGPCQSCLLVYFVYYRCISPKVALGLYLCEQQPPLKMGKTNTT